MKAELIGDSAYQTIENARASIFEYIEGYYNRTRLHSSLDYNSPEEYEQVLLNQLPSEGTENRRLIIPMKINSISSSLPKEGELFIN